MIGLIGSLVALTVSLAGVQSEPDRPRAGLELADLAAYRAALQMQPADPPPSVTFHDLWERAETWRGKPVSIRGRVVRVFRQDAVGEFTPLVEAWLSTQRGDLICMVYPWEKSVAADLRVGSSVRFSGTFLRTIRYPAGDEPRLAPLVVGSQPPVEDPRAETSGPSTPFPSMISASPTRLTAGAVVLTAAALILAWYHLHKTAPEHTISGRTQKTPKPGDPPLEFLDSEAKSG